MPNISINSHQRTSDWYRERQKLLTASDVSAILGYSKYKTPHGVFKEKTNNSTISNNSDQSTATQWGIDHEPRAIEEFYRRHASSLDRIEQVGLGIHPIVSYLGASPDAIAYTTDGQAWLVEVKCPYSRPILKSIPIDYWIQMQIQLYVWSALLEVPVMGCWYVECQYTHRSDRLVNYWEYPVKLDQLVLDEYLLPVLDIFWSTITRTNQTAPILRSSRHKRARHDGSGDTIQRVVLGWYEMLTLTDSRYLIQPRDHFNYFKRDPILSWFDRFGPPPAYQQLVTSSTPINEYGEINTKENQKSLFKSLIINKIKSLMQTEVREPFSVMDLSKFKIEEHISDPVTLNKSPENQLNPYLYKKTLECLKEKVPVILMGQLYDHRQPIVINYDVILQWKYAFQLFPTIKKKMENVSVKMDDYTFIQFHYSTLKLNSTNTYLLNSGHQDYYKALQLIGHDGLESHGVHCRYSLVIGRRSTHVANNCRYINRHVLSSIGLIDSERPQIESIRERLNQSIDWITRLNSQERQHWSLDPPKPAKMWQLYPNMKNKYDGKWSQVKHALAEKNKELTQIWYLGPVQRNRFLQQRVYSWGQLKRKDFDCSILRNQSIMNIIEANQSNRAINLEKLSEHLLDTRQPIEFFVDFEFLSGATDTLETFPVITDKHMIYQIGCIMVNHITKQTKYYSYLVNEYTHEQETQILKRWIADIEAFNNDTNSVYVYHWGSAELVQIRNKIEQLISHIDTIRDTPVVTPLTSPCASPIYREFKLIDLCKLFRQYQVGIPNAFSYGLKDIARAFYQNNWIKTTWIEADSSTDNNLHSSLHQSNLITTSGVINEAVTKLIKYNYVDCKVMEEIVNYLCHFT